jgi:hypothetical protein
VLHCGASNRIFGINMHRTTLNLEKDAADAARRYAAARGIALGRAVSELIQKGLNAQIPLREVNGLWVFDLPPDSPRVTSEDVRRALDD